MRSCVSLGSFSPLWTIVLGSGRREGIERLTPGNWFAIAPRLTRIKVLLHAVCSRSPQPVRQGRSSRLFWLHARQNSTTRDRQTSARLPERPWRRPAEVKRWAVLPVLGIEYRALAARTLEDGTDEDILAWAHAHGTPRTDEECVIWNRFMTKAGWRDDRSARLQQLVVEYGLVGKPIETVFDLFDYDEGRDPIAEGPWLRV